MCWAPMSSIEFAINRCLTWSLLLHCVLKYWYYAHESGGECKPSMFAWSAPGILKSSLWKVFNRDLIVCVDFVSDVFHPSSHQWWASRFMYKVQEGKIHHLTFVNSKLPCLCQCRQSQSDMKFAHKLKPKWGYNGLTIFLGHASLFVALKLSYLMLKGWNTHAYEHTILFVSEPILGADEVRGKCWQTSLAYMM